MGGSSRAPKPPNPYTTANAQNNQNFQTAALQQMFNTGINQYTPYGSMEYKQQGTQPMQVPVYDTKGNITGYKTQQVPKWGQYETFTPKQQELFEQQQAFDKKWNDLALQQTDRASGILSTPIDLNNETVEQHLWDTARKRMDPMWDQRQEQMETKLTNQGLAAGSEAWDDAMRSFNQGRNDQYTAQQLAGRQQALTELLTPRTQSLNEISTLMGGGQVQNPQWSQVPQVGVNGTDIAGLVGQNYQNQLAAWQQQQATKNAMLGGLFGMGGTIAGGWLGGGFGS